MTTTNKETATETNPDTKISPWLAMWFGEHCNRVTYSPSNMLNWRTGIRTSTRAWIAAGRPA